MLNEIINFINPDNKDLNRVSAQEMIEILSKLNRSLRGLDESENVIDENMSVGILVSPTKEVQIKTLEYLTQNMEKVQDKRAKAAMVYYTLLNLHMFNNGNGRTARFMYDLISGDLHEDNLAYYFHRNSGKIREQKRDLEYSKGIDDVACVNKIPDAFIGKQLDFIPKYVLENYSWITVGHTNTSPSTDTIIPKTALEQLSSKELQDLNKILQDGYGMLLCPSGVAMLYVSSKKGQLGDWINKNNNDLAQGIGIKGRLNFSIYRNPEMIGDWDANDFREIINVGNAVKYARLKCLIDIFAEPEKYINADTGHTYTEDILTRKITDKDQEMTR